MDAILWFDCETWTEDTDNDLTRVGSTAYNSSAGTHTQCCQWALDNGPVHTWFPGQAVPREVVDHVENGGLVAAYNTNFDRAHWQYVLTPDHGWPTLALEQCLCMLAQASACVLPPGLGRLSNALGLIYGKKPGAIMKKYLYAPIPESGADRDKYLEYAEFDIHAMREAGRSMRPLSSEEWREYHVSERINDRGVPVDVYCAALARDASARIVTWANKQFVRLTGISSTAHTTQLHDWLRYELEGSTALRLMGKPTTADPDRISSDKHHRALAACAGDAGARALEVLKVLEAASAATMHKYKAICERAIDGRVYDAYVFNGAGQTGRAASRGIQLHNMWRKALDEEHTELALDELEAWLAGGPQPPDVPNMLRGLMRPTIMAPEGKVLAWGDFSGIEARILPWLSETDGGARVLSQFDAGDPYVDAAKLIHGEFDYDKDDPEHKQLRQVGKVTHLASQYRGGARALLAMAAGYGMAMTHPQALDAVAAWRAGNQWVLDYGDALWAGAQAACAAPRTTIEVGRVRYIFAPSFLRGTLFCVLPCGRPLAYPHARFKEEYDEERDWWKTVLRTRQGALWQTSLLNEITQGTAASVLRAALTRLDGVLPVVMHTHDECVIEVDENKLDTGTLKQIMETTPEWMDDLRIPVETGAGVRYGK